jgi:tyrosyl-tRNA synthetase
MTSNIGDCCCREYKDMESLEADYASGALHPGDLKPGLVKQLNEILEPVRTHFQTDEHAAGLLKRVKSFKTTR